MRHPRAGGPATRRRRAGVRPSPLDLVAEPERVDVVAEGLHAGGGVQGIAEALRVTDRGDPERRRVDPALQDQGVADAADRTGGDHPLVHDLHRLGAAGPQRVDHRLHVLLVHDQVVGRGVLGQDPVRGPWRVGQRHLQAGPGRRARSRRPARATPTAAARRRPAGRSRPRGRSPASISARSRSTRCDVSSARRCSARIRSGRSLRAPPRRSAPRDAPALVANRMPAVAKASGAATRHSAAIHHLRSARGHPDCLSRHSDTPLDARRGPALTRAAPAPVR